MGYEAWHAEQACKAGMLVHMMTGSLAAVSMGPASHGLACIERC